MAGAPITLRPARSQDRDALIALQRRASLQHDAYRTDLEANPDAFDVPADQIADGDVIVAEREGKLVGFAAVVVVDDGVSDLDGLFVDPFASRGGIGRRLMDAAFERARAHGSSRMTVTAAEEAESFYRAVGFETDGMTSTRFGDAISMSMDLPAE